LCRLRDNKALTASKIEHVSVGINITEIIVVFVVALLLFGPEQLPNLARQAGRITGELRKHSHALRREFYNTVYPPDLAGDLRQGARSLANLKSELLAPPAGSAPVSREPQKPPTTPSAAAAVSAADAEAADQELSRVHESKV
jgi:sec-independent protein translocase protein TatB